MDYNAQIAVDEHKQSIIASHVTNNPSDHHELIPAIEQVKSNLGEIYNETPSNFQVKRHNGYSTDINAEYLEQEGFLDGYISSRKLSRKEKIQFNRKTIFQR